MAKLASFRFIPHNLTVHPLGRPPLHRPTTAMEHKKQSGVAAIVPSQQLHAQETQTLPQRRRAQQTPPEVLERQIQENQRRHGGVSGGIAAGGPAAAKHAQNLRPSPGVHGP